MAKNTTIKNTSVIIGYLHVGTPNHGVTRYGQFLTQEARKCDSLEVIETTIELVDDWKVNVKKIIQSTNQLSQADVVHFQFSQWIWGKKLRIFYLWLFIANCKCPTVATLHDIYVEECSLNLKQAIFNFEIKKIVKYIQAKLDWRNVFYYSLLRLLKVAFVCTKQEQERLRSIIGYNLRQKVVNIPHFVEQREKKIDSQTARRSLGLEKYKVVTLLGWIHGRKGHDLAVEALGMLPENFAMVFAGKYNERSTDFANQLIERAEQLGVSDRLRITGYLSEAKLEQYLFATDVALCPFRTCSASGSLSTWISVQHPRILVSDLPQIREYNSISPNSVKLLESLSPEVIAQSVIGLLNSSSTDQALAVEELQRKLEISSIFDKHLKYYSQLVHI
mgnify:CR=1 FL=1